MNSYEKSKKWSDQFIPLIKQIIGPMLLHVSSFEVDTTQAADLVLIKPKDMGRDFGIACRIRRPNYIKYWPQFTIRSRSKYGGKTEIHKLIEGWGDWLFYGYSGNSNNNIFLDHWLLIDLSVWRDFVKAGKIFTPDIYNYDGTAFRAYDVNDFPENSGILIKSSHPTVEPASELSTGIPLNVDEGNKPKVTCVKCKREFRPVFITTEGMCYNCLDRFTQRSIPE
ncbi:MAG: hypothetical protein P9L92_16255 [Candidatus Electryonea clarkiae]|nr:hypothetical protein [Candidatus Electryonea clarkiae]MDP8288585.1 hypothetical protein [Candidatus Electryonea clarkiae]